MFQWLTDRIHCWLAGIAVVSALTSPVAAQSLDETFGRFDAGSKTVIDHSAFQTFLEKYLTSHEDGVTRIAYGNVSADDRALLDGYVKALEEVTVTGLNRGEQFAYWANLYNAVTVRLIVENYPVDSIRDINDGLFSFGPWGRKLVTVEGRALTLDNIEHDILREIWEDPRVHYAVNCASIGCPNLNVTPFTGAGLDKQLTANARAYVNHPRGAAFRGRRLYVSRIYRWFREDFGGSEQGILRHLRQYADEDLAEKLEDTDRISGYRYDWSLNDSTDLDDTQ